MNVIRAGSSCFRANCKTSYKQAVTAQCMFSSKLDDDGNHRKNNKDNDEKNATQAIRKPFDLKLKTKSMKIQKSRIVKGTEAISQLFGDKRSEKKNKSVNKTERNEEQYFIKTLDNENVERKYERKKRDSAHIKLPTPSKPVSERTSMDPIKKIFQEAASELGGDFKETQETLKEAYKSVKGSYLEKQKYSEQKKYVSKTKHLRNMSDKKQHSLGVSSIFAGNRLEIFTERIQQKEKMPHLKLWNKLHEKSLLDLTFGPPKNYFEELLLWTYHGKLWHFPIDNEQGLDLEKNTDFTEHIFLEEHLEPWCPKSGPLRHFMELVTVGLSKNPYLSVEDKKEHIFWYRDYFESKKKLLQEVGALDTDTQIDTRNTDTLDNPESK